MKSLLLTLAIFLSHSLASAQSIKILTNHLGYETVGPKRALTGMMRELAPGRTAVAVAAPAAIQELSLPG